jgi:hypothetical protein
MDFENFAARIAEIGVTVAKIWQKRSNKDLFVISG